MELREKSAALEQGLGSLGSLLVAYSGGTDSAYLAFAAHRALGERMLAVIADSASLPRKELADALAFTAQHGIPTEILRTAELENPAYAKNDAQRCFHCKDELFQQMERARERLGFRALAYGMNLDDGAEFRPGQQAARLHGALAPLAAAGLTKQEIRTLAREAGLTLADKPASACLSSRIEYGRPVTVGEPVAGRTGRRGAASAGVPAGAACGITGSWHAWRLRGRTCRGRSILTDAAMR